MTAKKQICRFFFGIALSFSTWTVHADVVYLVSLPRSCTTVFERSMKARGDFKIVHEPFWQLHLESFLRPQDSTERAGLAEIVKNSSSSQDIIDSLHQLSETTHQRVFVKDFVSCAGKEFMKRPEYVKRPDVHFIILFREPLKTLTSYFLTMRSLPDFLKPAFDPETAMSYNALAAFYEFLVKTKNSPPILVDADQLTKNPRETMQRVCAGIGIPFMEKSLHWESGYQEEWHPQARAWHIGVEHSVGFAPDPTIGQDELNESEQALVTKIFAANFDSYSFLLKNTSSG